ncbi:hypothetical protein PSTT_04945 [Puccinia striiformis]|uniref:HECT domain-containing protein n=1 Tax=Puccinia striiformis TaxID=27350 RepID=A0A2S4VQM9_9BASI|nr:hypothetical protein PSTT_04945 [Puccinia striiformis]
MNTTVCWKMTLMGFFELTFSVEANDFGSTRIVDLHPGRQEIPVTTKNKPIYVQPLVQNRTDGLYLRTD